MAKRWLIAEGRVLCVEINSNAKVRARYSNRSKLIYQAAQLRLFFAISVLVFKVETEMEMKSKSKTKPKTKLKTEANKGILNEMIGEDFNSMSFACSELN